MNGTHNKFSSEVPHAVGTVLKCNTHDVNTVLEWNKSMDQCENPRDLKSLNPHLRGLKFVQQVQTLDLFSQHFQKKCHEGSWEMIKVLLYMEKEALNQNQTLMRHPWSCWYHSMQAAGRHGDPLLIQGLINELKNWSQDIKRLQSQGYLGEIKIFTDRHEEESRVSEGLWTQLILKGHWESLRTLMDIRFGMDGWTPKEGKTHVQSMISMAAFHDQVDWMIQIEDLEKSSFWKDKQLEWDINMEPPLNGLRMAVQNEFKSMNPLEVASFHGHINSVRYLLDQYHRRMKNKNNSNDPKESESAHEKWKNVFMEGWLMACRGGHVSVMKEWNEAWKSQCPCVEGSMKEREAFIHQLKVKGISAAMVEGRVEAVKFIASCASSLFGKENGDAPWSWACVNRSVFYYVSECKHWDLVRWLVFHEPETMIHWESLKNEHEPLHQMVQEKRAFDEKNSLLQAIKNQDHGLHDAKHDVKKVKKL